MRIKKGRWKADKIRQHFLVKATLERSAWKEKDQIDNLLKERRLMRSLERFVGFNTTAGNLVKKILLKMNLSDHRSILTDLKMGGGVNDFLMKDVALKFFKSAIQERYEHVGSEITNLQDGKVSRWRRDCAWLIDAQVAQDHQCQIQS
ncbi:hypothetical protein Tco_0150107 [Tanacetum coccineum]